MSNQLKARITSINNRLETKDPLAFEDAVELSLQYPDEAQVWNTLAYAYEWKNDYAAAAIAMTRAIELRPGRPGLFFTRGGHFLMAGDYESAIADFTEGIVLGSHLEHEPNREVLYFLRAEAYYQLGRKAEAIVDLEHVADDCTIWTVQVRSKAELLSLCGVDVPPAPKDAKDRPHLWDSLDADAHLLLQDRSVLPKIPGEDEIALMRELGVEGLAKADATLLKCVVDMRRKVARILFDAISTDGLDPTNTHARVYLRRLIGLAEAGAIEVAGNLNRPRFSEVRLPQPDE